ncbi:hypothetical protein B0T21DRAFT_412991 [Apiosordaria backusii]|uniref:Uncharacterized protein n=1 Tax=Apiosordaria backusii TaxID=314023 RepID=A0AA40BEN0_9PEZI|nr:hypothetical protein B0T21DRAFT_412991 [Apiosordaria backusii]
MMNKRANDISHEERPTKIARRSLTPAEEAHMAEIHASQVSKGGVPSGMTGVFSIKRGTQGGRESLPKCNTDVRKVVEDPPVVESGIRETLRGVPKIQEAAPEKQERTPKMITLRRQSKTPSERESTPNFTTLRRPSKTPPERGSTPKIIILRRPSKTPPEGETEAEPAKKKTIIKLKSPAATRKTSSARMESILGPLRPSLLPPSRTEPPPPLTRVSSVTNTSTGPNHSYGLRSRRPRLLQL